MTAATQKQTSSPGGIQYEIEDRWHQMVVSVSKKDMVLKTALRQMADEEGRSLSNQICLILSDHLRENGWL